MCFSLSFLLISFHCGSWILDLVITDLVHICALGHRRHAYSQGELPSLKIPPTPLFFGSFMSECFFLCWSHVDGSSKALFYFKSCSRWDSFLLDSSDVISRSRVLSLQGDSVVFLLWDYLIFGCNMYDDCRDGVGLKTAGPSQPTVRTHVNIFYVQSIPG